MQESDKNLLLAFAAFYGLGVGILSLPVGCFVGWHILIPAVAHVLLGVVAFVVLMRKKT